VCKDQVREENRRTVSGLPSLTRGIDNAGCRERATGSSSSGDYLEPNLGLLLPRVFPQQWHGYFMKDRKHLYFNPVSSLKVRSCPSKG